MSLIESFVRNPVKITVGVLLVSMFGVMALFHMPMQLIPEVQIPTVTVETMWPGASPQEVEREIVQEQEEQLKSVEGVTKMSSESMDSMGRVTLEFAVGTDMSQALLKVNTKLQQVPSYPENAKEPVINTSNSSDRPIAWFILSQKTPSDEQIAAFQRQHPELTQELDHVLKARNDGLKMLRLRKLSEKEAVVQELMPPYQDVSLLRKFAEDFIEARFENVAGVSNSTVLGGREEEMQVIVDSERLAARQLTINDLRVALRGQNKDTSAGDFWEGKRRYVVRTLGQFRSPQQVENAIVARRNGAPVYVKDVAEVHLGHKKPDGFVRRFGTNSIAINAQRGVGENILTVMEGLRKANAELNAGVLKQRGLQLTQVYDETEYIHSSINLVTDNLLQGAALTFVTLLLFLRSARSTVVIFLHILVSTIGAFLAMNLLGRSLNVPALGGLAFAVGMLVDNAIVMLENIYRRHQMGEEVVTASVRGASEVWGALLNATLANLAVFLPILFVKEEAGQLFRDIALAISAAVGLSMIVAVTVVPTMAVRLLQRPRESRLTRWFARPPANPTSFALWRFLHPAAVVCRWSWRSFKTVFLDPLDVSARWFVNAVVGINLWLQRGIIWRIALLLVFVGGASGLTWLMFPKVEYLPVGNRNLVIGMLFPPPGYNLDQLTKMGEQIETLLKPYWDVDPDSPEAAQLDFPPIGDFFYVARSRQVFLGLRAADPMRAAELVALVRKVVANQPGTLGIGMQSSLFDQTLTGGRNIDVEISGPDLNKLVALGGRIFGHVRQILPTAQAIPKPSLDLSNPELHVEPKWEQAADMGVSAADLGYTVDALVDGAYATDYFVGGDKIDLRIMGQERSANRTQAIAELSVATPTGELVPLAALADVRLGSGPEQINHRTRQRAITIQVTPPPEVPLEAAMDLIKREIVEPLQQSGELEGVYRIDLAGTADKLRATWQALRFNVILAILITYMLMAATFESWLYPFVVILTVPIGAVGGFAGLWLLNRYVQMQSLDVLTMLGFIMLVGTVVNNPILIVEQSLVHMRDDGLPLRQAILESVRNRIRPIFMTTLGGLVGLLPLVIAPGAGSELYRGIGAVLLGGLLVSTVVTLVFVPAMLSLMMEAKQGLLRLLRREESVSRETLLEPTLVESVAAVSFEPARATAHHNGDGNGVADSGSAQQREPVSVEK